MLCSSSKEVAVCLTITSKPAVTRNVSVNNVKADLLLKGIFIREQRTQRLSTNCEHESYLEINSPHTGQLFLEREF